MRAWFFGADASTAHDNRATTERARRLVPLGRTRHPRRGRHRPPVREHADSIELVIHTAAQPSHDWAATNPQVDFAVNANGTLNLLEAARRHAAAATFVSARQQGLRRLPNQLPLIELEQRLELPPDHRYYGGIDTTMSIDSSTHSLFGVSKASADLLVQEYGRYFDMPTVCFRGGCLTGPNHAGTKLHGFLLLPDALRDHRRALHHLRLRRQTGSPTNIHSADLVAAFAAFHARRARPGLTTSAVAARALLDARSDRDVRAYRWKPARLDARAGERGSATHAGG